MAGNRFIPDFIEDRLPDSKSKKEKQQAKRRPTDQAAAEADYKALAVERSKPAKKASKKQLPGADLLRDVLSSQLAPIARYAKPVVKSVNDDVGAEVRKVGGRVRGLPDALLEFLEGRLAGAQANLESRFGRVAGRDTYEIDDYERIHPTTSRRRGTSYDIEGNPIPPEEAERRRKPGVARPGDPEYDPRYPPSFRKLY